MSITPLVAGISLAGALVLGANIASGQNYPNKPIRLVTGSGAPNIVSRLVAPGISGPLGQPVIVDSRGGNQQLIVIGASPDGYTVLVSGSSLWLAPLTQKMPYDAIKDFAPVSILGKTPYILFVTPSLPGSVKELIALAKAKPGQLNNSVGGIGGGAHLAGELFKSLAGVNIVAVPYSSSSQEITDIVSGRVQLTFTTPSSLMEQVKLGKLRALAVTTAEPSALAPELPTMAAAGVPGYDWRQTIGMVAPAQTPDAFINRLNQEVARFLKTPDVRERLLTAGVEPVGSSPRELATTIQSDIVRVGKLVKELGIKTE